MNPYLTKFFNSNSAADILPIFSNYKKVIQRNKEITESMAMLQAAIDYGKFNPKDDSVHVYVVGDGIRPRTGMITAYFTSWNVFSIDPQLDKIWWNNFYEFKSREGFPPKRLSLWPKKVEELVTHGSFGTDNQMIIMPHSHANLDVTLQVISGKSTLITMPCCVGFNDKLKSKKALEKFLYRSYMDFNVLSGKKTIHIWHDIDYEGYQDLLKK